MIYQLISLIFLSATVNTIPQRNQPISRERRPTGQEFVDLLPEDFTNEDYKSLLDEFKAIMKHLTKYDEMLSYRSSCN